MSGRAGGGHGFDLLVVGLTGGIASGKSAVSAMLEEAGIPVIDADRLAREVVEPGRPAYEEVLAAFGPSVVAPDGRLDRKRLGEIVFRDAAARARLESIVHPRVFEAERAELARLARMRPASVVAIDAALLIESGNYRWMDAVVLVGAPRAEQIARLVRHRGLTRAEAEARVDAQWPLEAKRPFADYEIDNGGSLEATRRQVSVLVEALAARRAGTPGGGGTGGGPAAPPKKN